MFRVGTGLDSQILGDFEIISQIRTSFSQSKSLGLASNMERLVNVIQASKKIKTDTEISSEPLRSLLLLFNI
jgi:glutamyl-tRNA reductase